MATAGKNGRAVVVKWDAVTLVGVRSRTAGVSAEYVDVTTDDDAGWRKLLSDPGVRSVEVTVSGIANSEAVLASIMAASVTGETLEITLPSTLTTPGKLSGTFQVSGFEISADHDGAAEFSATFMSDGAVTYTASA